MYFLKFSNLRGDNITECNKNGIIFLGCYPKRKKVMINGWITKKQHVAFFVPTVGAFLELSFEQGSHHGHDDLELVQLNLFW